jgi:hypothetical protein
MPRRRRAAIPAQLRTQRRDVSRMIEILASEGYSQKMIGESLNVSGAVVSLLKNEKYPASLDRYVQGLKKLLDDAGVSDDVGYRRASGRRSTSYGEWLAEQVEKLDLTPAALAQNAGLSTLTVNYILDGTTSNPQSGTRRRIDAAVKALAGSAGKKVASAPPPSVSSDEIFSGIPFSEQEINQVPDEKGVYAIHDRRGYPTYIGQGKVRSRLKNHKDHKAFVDQRVASSFSYVILKKGDAADEQARWLENLVTKFAGNTVLLNKKLITDLSDAE